MNKFIYKPAFERQFKKHYKTILKGGRYKKKKILKLFIINYYEMNR